MYGSNFCSGSLVNIIILFVSGWHFKNSERDVTQSGYNSLNKFWKGKLITFKERSTDVGKIIDKTVLDSFY